MNRLLAISCIAYIVSVALNGFGEIAWLASLLWFALGAWIQHIVSTIKSDKMSLLLVGSILFPIGIINGGMIWVDSFSGLKDKDAKDSLTFKKAKTILSKTVSIFIALVGFGIVSQVLLLIGPLIGALLILMFDMAHDSQGFKNIEATGNIITFIICVQIAILIYRKLNKLQGIDNEPNAR